MRALEIKGPYRFSSNLQAGLTRFVKSSPEYAAAKGELFPKEPKTADEFLSAANAADLTSMQAWARHIGFGAHPAIQGISLADFSAQNAEGVTALQDFMLPHTHPVNPDGTQMDGILFNV